MRWFYHFSPVKLRKKARNIILVTACFCAEICVAAFIVMFFNFFTARNHDVVLQMLMIICGAILLGMIVCFGAAMISWHKISRRSRYTYVDIHDRTYGIGDMELISLCKHNIISNSTFSWWATVFNKNQRKLVIAPNKWDIRPRALLLQSEINLWFEDWIRIEG